MSKLCANCGQRSMEYVESKGKTFEWKDYINVKLEDSLHLLTCNKCGHIGLMDNEIEKLNLLLRDNIKRQFNKMLVYSIEKYNCEQQTIAQRIGVTPEHLSQLKTGKMVPSFQTFNFLKILAIDKNAYIAANPEISL